MQSEKAHIDLGQETLEQSKETYMGQKYIGWLHRIPDGGLRWGVKLNYMNDGTEFRDGPMVREYADVHEAIDKTEEYLGFKLRLDETIDQFMGYRIREPEHGSWPLKPAPVPSPKALEPWPKPEASGGGGPHMYDLDSHAWDKKADDPIPWADL